MSQLPAAIRKAAVLVLALDDQAADTLLAQMGPELAARVRNAMMELDHIPPAEQEAVLAEFLRGGGVSMTAEGDGGVELDESLVRKLDEPQLSSHSNAQTASGEHCERPFDFLRHVQPSRIAAVLSREQPQVMSVVVAHLEADLAAQILEALPPPLATDVLERMAWLEQPDPQVLGDIERHLRGELAPDIQRAGQRSDSLANLHAVLGAMDATSRGRVLDGLAARNWHLSRELERDQPFTRQTSPSRADLSRFRYRLEQPEDRDRAAGSLVDFDDFSTFSDETLRRVFAAAKPQVVLLALTGADEALLSRILRQLSAREAAALRARLNQPGAVRLSDIEAAQEHLADLARRMAEQGMIVLPGSRHFAAAA